MNSLEFRLLTIVYTAGNLFVGLTSKALFNNNNIGVALKNHHLLLLVSMNCTDEVNVTITAGGLLQGYNLSCYEMN